MADKESEDAKAASSGQGSGAAEQPSGATASAPQAEENSTPPEEQAPAEPLREDFVQNAVKFLSHPKVQGSPVQYRRSFLEKKGLTAAEIDEAFTRVPDSRAESTSAATFAPASRTARVATGAAPTGLGTGASARSVQQAPTYMQQQPYAAVSVPQGASQQPQLVMQQPMQMVAAPAQPKPSIRWTQMVLALGVLSAAGAGTALVAKNYFLPRLKLLMQRWLFGSSEQEGKPNPLEEAAAAASAAASAAANAASLMEKGRTDDRERLDAVLAALQAQTKELKGALGSVKDALEIIDTARKEAVIMGAGSGLPAGNAASVADLQKELQEMKSLLVKTATTANQSQGYANPNPQYYPTQPPGFPGAYEPQPWHSSATTGYGGAPPNMGPVSVPVINRDSYSDSAVRPAQRWGTTGGLETSAPPLAPASSLPAGSAPRPTSSGGLEPRKVEEDSRPVTAPPLGEQKPSEEPPQSKSYAEVMKMVQEGKTPPNVRKIDDRPPNPDQQPSSAILQPRAKPWERPTVGATSGGGSTGTPWWQAKPRGENGPSTFDTQAGSSGAEGGSGSGGGRAGWRPPAVPALSMPSAQAAIAGKPQKMTSAEGEAVVKAVENGSAAVEGGGDRDGSQKSTGEGMSSSGGLESQGREASGGVAAEEGAEV